MAKKKAGTGMPSLASMRASMQATGMLPPSGVGLEAAPASLATPAPPAASVAGLEGARPDRWRTQLESEPIVELDIALVDPDDGQMRRVIVKEGIDDLAEMIQTSGQLQPALVRPKPDGRYRLIFGHRRRLALLKLGRTTIRAVVREASDIEAKVMQIQENLGREGVADFEKAWVVRDLLELNGGDAEKTAAAAGKSVPWVTQMLNLTKLEPLTEAQVRSGKLVGDYTLITKLNVLEKVSPAAAQDLIAQDKLNRTAVSDALKVAKGKPRPAGGEYASVIAGKFGLSDSSVQVTPQKNGSFKAVMTLTKEQAEKLLGGSR